MSSPDANELIMISLLLIIFFLAVPAFSAEWEYVNPMPTAREGLAVAELDGKIYAIGGKNHSGFMALDIVEVYDPEENSWETAPSLIHHRMYAAAAAYDGKIFVFGGRNGMWMINDVEMYDPIVGYWVEVTNMFSREGLSATTMGDYILVVGGKFNQWSYSPEVDVYNPVTYDWQGNLPNYPFPRAGHGAVTVGDSLYIIGGVSYWMMNDVSLYNGSNWQNGPNLPFPLGNTGAAIIGYDIYVVGGNNGWFSSKKALKRSCNISGSWIEIDSLNTGRDYHGVVACGDKLYAIGGGYGMFDNRVYLASVEMLDLTVGVNPPPQNKPQSISLSVSNYPNPFSQFTNIDIQLVSPAAPVQPVIIYDILGREVMRWNAPVWQNGNIRLNWNGNDNLGRQLPSGVYFLQVNDELETVTRKISIVR